MKLITYELEKGLTKIDFVLTGFKLGFLDWNSIENSRNGVVVVIK